MKTNIISKKEELKNNQSFNSKKILSFREALVFLDISASTLYKKTHKRTIPFFKPSPKRIYFLKEDLINYMLSNRQDTLKDLTIDNNKYLNRENHE